MHRYADFLIWCAELAVLQSGPKSKKTGIRERVWKNLHSSVNHRPGWQYIGPVVNSHDRSKRPILHTPKCGYDIKDNVMEVAEKMEIFIDSITREFWHEDDVKNLDHWLSTVISKCPIHLQTPEEIEEWRKHFGRQAVQVGLPAPPPPPAGTALAPPAPPGPPPAVSAEAREESQRLMN